MKAAAGPNTSRLTIDLWTNLVAGGWHPAQLQSGLGGGEESLVLWTAALAHRGHRPRVYHNGPSAGACIQNGGVAFLPHSAFDPFEHRDVMVSWKSHHPWRVGTLADLRIHWSSDVEPAWPSELAGQVDAFITFSPFHRESMPWLPASQTLVIPLGVDLGHLQRHISERISGRAIYASSPDRGLELLLRDWPRLRAAHPGLRLDVHYGWKQFMACTVGNPRAVEFRSRMDRLLIQEGVRYRGAVSRDDMARAYWEAEYWMLPLQKAESELFCLNAVKAMHCGAVGVVNRIGALRHTVSRWIEYEAFRSGETEINYEPVFSALSWDQVIERYWEPLFKDAGCKS